MNLQPILLDFKKLSIFKIISSQVENLLMQLIYVYVIVIVAIQMQEKSA